MVSSESETLVAANEPFLILLLIRFAGVSVSAGVEMTVTGTMIKMRNNPVQRFFL